MKGKREKITDSEIIAEVKKWFEQNWRSKFISKPEHYNISINRDDNIFIHGKWDDGITDFCGLGNKYEFLWEHEI